MYMETFKYEVPCPSPISQIGDGQIQNPVAPASVDNQAKGPMASSAIAVPAAMGASGNFSPAMSEPPVAESVDAETVASSTANIIFGALTSAPRPVSSATDALAPSLVVSSRSSTTGHTVRRHRGPLLQRRAGRLRERRCV